jgi:hypothetical protein
MPRPLTENEVRLTEAWLVGQIQLYKVQDGVIRIHKSVGEFWLEWLQETV